MEKLSYKGLLNLLRLSLVVCCHKSTFIILVGTGINLQIRMPQSRDSKTAVIITVFLYFYLLETNLIEDLNGILNNLVIIQRRGLHADEVCFSFEQGLLQKSG